MKTWEEAFGALPSSKPKDKLSAEIQAEQRKIQQQEWTDALPNLGDTRDELGKIYDLVKDKGFYREGEHLHKSIEHLIDLQQRLAAQSDRVRKAMSIL